MRTIKLERCYHAAFTEYLRSIHAPGDGAKPAENGGGLVRRDQPDTCGAHPSNACRVFQPARRRRPGEPGGHGRPRRTVRSQRLRPRAGGHGQRPAGGSHHRAHLHPGSLSWLLEGPAVPLRGQLRGGHLPGGHPEHHLLGGHPVRRGQRLSHHLSGESGPLYRQRLLFPEIYRGL